MKISEITTSNLADYLKLEYDELTDAELAFLVSIQTASNAYILSYTGLTAEEADTHDDFVIVVYVLVQDMYDNRSMYVEKSNLNKVVETILGMHCVNLL
jgi:hypothetical protein